jgi:hypothetical protein
MTQRTESARQALDQYCLSKGEPLDTLETGIIDLLTDLLHLAQIEGQDGFMLGQTAQMHFLIETEHMRNP